MQIEKQKVQQEAVNELIKHNGTGLITMATGSGKSKVAIDYISTFWKKGMNGILIVPTEKLRDREWELEFTKWNKLDIYNSLRKECYMSIAKIKDENFDFVIFDEIQFITPKNSSFFENNLMSKAICLSATPPVEKDKKEILKKYGIENIYHLSLDDAVKRKIVAPYEIIFINIPLNNVIKYVKAGSKDKPFYVTEKQNYDYLTKRIELLMNMSNPNYSAIKFTRLARSRLIYNSMGKHLMGKSILSELPEEERTLIFSGSIKLAEKISPYTFHSKSTDENFVKFTNGKINRLSTVNSLNVGVNIDNLDNAIILQVQSKERHLIQRIGRIVRYRDGHKAKIYIGYIRGTVDEDWVKSAMKNLDKSVITKTIKLNYSV
jgi:superfamily II DNA or RNA helicase